MKKTILFFFSFAIIMTMIFVGCNIDSSEQKSNSTTTLEQFLITYNDKLHADNFANPKTFTAKDTVTLQNLKKTGYTFYGWYDASTDGNKVTGWNAGDRTSDVELWAKWNYIENESGNIVINEVRMLKTSMVTVLDTTADITCDQFNGAFVTGRSQVKVSPYAIGRYEVTQGLFNAVMGTNPSKFVSSEKPLDTKDGLTETDSLLRPVEQVNWYHAIAFCNKLSLLLGKTPCYSVNGVDWVNLVYGDIPTSSNYTWNNAKCDFNANGYRLPTDVEWECAARGGMYSTTTTWTDKYAGSDNIDKVAWYNNNSNNHPWEVGLKQPNTLDLFDFSGNVNEWCWDWFNSDITKEDYTGPSSGSARVYRGGYWGDTENYCDLSYRYNYSPDNLVEILGLRLACSIRQ